MDVPLRSDSCKIPAKTSRMKNLNQVPQSPSVTGSLMKTTIRMEEAGSR